MTCEQFFERHYDTARLANWIDEMFWEQSFSTNRVFDDMCARALEMGIKLTDKYDWDYDGFFWNVYQNTEKGLS